MKYDVSFVTCIYDDIHNTDLTGRHNRGTHYAFSLAQMHEMGAPIYCYTDKINMYKFFPTFLLHGYENFKFISYNLSDSPLHKEIQRVKKTDPDRYFETPGWKIRCVEIMWGKFDWLIHVIEKIGLADDKYVFWIDAGLAHSGILPLRFNTHYRSAKYQSSSHDYNNRFYFDQIFNADLPDFLVDYIDGKELLHFICNKPQHNDPMPFKLENVKYIGTAVGGLFGGTTRMMDEWSHKGKAFCEKLLQHDCIVKEEDVLSYLINLEFQKNKNFAEKIKIFSFDTWYHEDWDKNIYDPSEVSFSHFFDLFLNR